MFISRSWCHALAFVGESCCTGNNCYNRDKVNFALPYDMYPEEMKGLLYESE